jgi:hypothetical protein
MRAPAPATPESLPARVALIIIASLFLALAALWFFIATGKMMISLGVGALALIVAALCALTYRRVLT